MESFIYTLGWLLYGCLTLWLAMLGALVLWDRCIRRIVGERPRLQGEYMLCAAVFSTFALVAGSIDHYILSPALGEGVNFFFGS